MFFCLLAAGQDDGLDKLTEEMVRRTAAGDIAGAGRLIPSLLAALEEHGPRHPSAVLAWNQIAVSHHMQGHFAEAEKAYLRAIRLFEKQVESSTGLELLYQNLATLYLDMGGRPGHAETLCRRGLKLAMKRLGPLHPELGRFLYTLGAARQMQNDLIDARRFYQQALSVSTGGSPAERIRNALIMANLGLLEWKEGRLPAAKDIMMRAITLFEKAADPSHPDLIASYINLARVHEQLHEWSRAGECVRRAREIAESRLGPTHPHLAEILTSSASILRKTGHRKEVLKIEQQVKAILAVQPQDVWRNSSVHLSDLAPPGHR